MMRIRKVATVQRARLAKFAMMASITLKVLAVAAVRTVERTSLVLQDEQLSGCQAWAMGVVWDVECQRV